MRLGPTWEQLPCTFMVCTFHLPSCCQETQAGCRIRARTRTKTRLLELGPEEAGEIQTPPCLSKIFASFPPQLLWQRSACPSGGPLPLQLSPCLPSRQAGTTPLLAALCLVAGQSGVDSLWLATQQQTFCRIRKVCYGDSKSGQFQRPNATFRVVVRTE